MPDLYPPLQQAPVDSRTTLFTRPWAIFFQDWVKALGIVTGSGTGTGTTPIPPLTGTGYFAPLTTGPDAATTELVFNDRGECVMVWVPREL
jgi:hypothetical protein